MKTLIVSLCFAGLLATGIVQGAPDAIVKDVLTTALAGPDGEYAAYAEYTAIIENFGEVAPYVNIRAAETRHINALKRQCEKYGVAIPENAYLGKITPPANLIEAAKQNAAAEERNVAMYDQLLAKVKDYSDLTRVLTNLRRASLENHLPAFKAAAEGKTPVCGGGGQRRQGKF
jgi:rubrerythrin